MWTTLNITLITGHGITFGMQSLSMVYDRDRVMKILLTVPLPRWYMLLAKLISGFTINNTSLFFVICIIVNIYTPFLTDFTGWLAFFIVLFGLMLGSRLIAISLYQTIRKFCWNYEFCNISNVFYFICSLPVVALVDNGALFGVLLKLPFTYGVEMVGWFRKVLLRGYGMFIKLTIFSF